MFAQPMSMSTKKGEAVLVFQHSFSSLEHGTAKNRIYKRSKSQCYIIVLQATAGVLGRPLSWCAEMRRETGTPLSRGAGAVAPLRSGAVLAACAASFEPGASFDAFPAIAGCNAGAVAPL